MHRVKKVAVLPVFALLLSTAGACSDMPVTPIASPAASGTTPLATALSSYISGPTQVPAEGVHTWYANPSGGNGIYTYKWQYQVAGSYGWTDVGTGANYSRRTGPSSVTFHLRLVVTSDATSFTSTIQVTIAGGCAPTC